MHIKESNKTLKRQSDRVSRRGVPLLIMVRLTQLGARLVKVKQKQTSSIGAGFKQMVFFKERQLLLQELRSVCPPKMVTLRVANP